MATAIPAIMAVIGTGYGIYSSERQNRAQRAAMQQQRGVSDEALATGREWLGQARQAVGPALGYYSSMLANPREASAPEQNRVGTLYQAQAQNVRSQYPRGGYGLTQAENVRGQQRAANESIIQQGRPMAAGALSNLFGGLGQMGMQGFGLGSGILGNVFNQGMMARQQSFNEGSAMGQGLFNAYNMYLMGRATNSTTPGTSGNSNYGIYGPGITGYGN